MVGGTGDGQMPVMPVATTWYESAPTQTYESVPEATSRSLDEPAYAAVDEPVYAASVEEPMYASLAAPAAADATSRSVAYVSLDVSEGKEGVCVFVCMREAVRVHAPV